jgi:ubiquinone biosynthesis protein COQ4
MPSNPTADAPLVLAAPSPALPFDWRNSLRILKELNANPDRTELVFELFDTAGGGGFERSFQRFAADPEGQRLLRERPSLVDAMADSQALAALPDGSFGRVYLDFARARDFAANGLVEINHETNEENGQNDDPHRAYYGDRVTAMHDLWHVLTDYGTDEAGEGTLLAFSLAQIPSRGFLLLVMLSASVLPMAPLFRCQRHLLEAWRRGRRAARLDRARYEDLLPLPLDVVRRQLGIQAAAVAHPHGILRRIDGEELRWVTV